MRVQSDPRRQNGKTLITRRRFLLGAAGVGAAVAVAAGANAYVSSERERNAIQTLKVPAANVFTNEDCSEGDLASAFALEGEYTLPFGSLVFCTDDDIACCLTATAEASPLVQVETMALSTGKQQTVLDQAVGAGNGFEIYDARATSQGIVWTEADIFAGTWNIYCAALSNGGGMGTARLVDSGDSAVQTPSIGAVGPKCFWTIMPPSDADDATTGTAQLKAASFSSGSADVVWEGRGRMACGLYSASDGVVIAPRHPQSTRYYQLLHVEADSGSVDDSLTLPSGMKPVEIGWGANGFSFCFESIYNYGDGIANLGTYTPARPNSGYVDASWFRFGRTPFAAPAWCGSDWFIVKSTTVVSAIDPATKTYVSFGSVDGATSWGDYLATSGTRDRIVTYATVDKTLSDGTTEQRVDVRVWKPASKAARTADG